MSDMKNQQALAALKAAMLGLLIAHNDAHDQSLMHISASVEMDESGEVNGEYQLGRLHAGQIILVCGGAW